MPDKSTFFIIAVTVGAFLIGYWLISLIIRWVQNLNARPPLNEEFPKDSDDGTRNHP